jgi:pimeloyl-ACP methyl ester carboxylesterase
MANDIYNKFYRKAPQDQMERLKKFRSTHPYKHLTIDGITWKYTSCGQGKETLLLLTGGSGIGEAMALVFASLENEYQIISPLYPTITTIEQLADGIVRILESEGIHKVNILGQSFGGILAQVIVHKYPEKVIKLILSHTTTTSPPVDQARVLEWKKTIEKKLKIFTYVPISLFRLLLRSRISRLMSMMNTEEKGFWKAYFHEMVSRMTKEEQFSLSKCMLDFSNYAFSKNDLANWPGKILILESDNDPSFPPSERRALKELYPQAPVHTFHGTGHLTIIVEREEFLSVVRRFLGEKGTV